MPSKIKYSLLTLLIVSLLIACNRAPETADLSESLPNEPTLEPQDNTATEIDEDVAVDTASTADLTETTYAIVPVESTARFELDENLRSALTGWHRGSRITVVGTTDQLFGEMTLDPSDLSTIQFDDLRINAFTLDTDDYYRTRMIQQRILESDVYEFITFSPTRVVDLPESAEIGDVISFSLEGELTIRDMTLSQTFAVTASLVSPTQISGLASTTVDYASYGLVIPAVPHVSEIEDEVELYIDFVAKATP